MQLKGSKQVDAEGRSAKLSRDERDYSQELKVSTLNKYLYDGYCVMLAFADLTQHEDARQCGVYYKWVDPELESGLREHRGQDTITFRVPKSQEISAELDIFPYLEEIQNRNRALRGLYDVVNEQTSDPIGKVQVLGERFSGGIYLETVLQDPETPWLNPPKGSVEYDLNSVDNHIKSYNISMADKLLDSIAEKASKASDHVKGEFYYQRARFFDLTGEDELASEHYGLAKETCPDKTRYRLAYLENMLNNNYEDKNACEEIASEIESEKDIEFVRLRAKALAFVGDEGSIDILDEFPEREVIVVKAFCCLFLKKYELCYSIAKGAIEHLGLDVAKRLRLEVFLARALFALGFKTKELGRREFISFAGRPEMDDEVLRECWGHTVEAWDLAKQLNYPADLAYIIDISSILGMYFREIDTIYADMKSFACKYEKFGEVQEGLLGIAFQKQDYSTVAEQLKKVKETPDIIVYRIMSNYRQKQAGQVVQIAVQHLDSICENRPRNLDMALLVSAECAERLALEDEKRKFLERIEELPNSESILAVYELFESLNKSLLNRDDALRKLYGKYESGCHDSQVLCQLVLNMNPTAPDE